MLAGIALQPAILRAVGDHVAAVSGERRHHVHVDVLEFDSHGLAVSADLGLLELGLKRPLDAVEQLRGTLFLASIARRQPGAVPVAGIEDDEHIAVARLADHRVPHVGAGQKVAVDAELAAQVLPQIRVRARDGVALV